MTIVRELVTKLSFQVDRRGIENFNRSILGLKTKIALATTAVTGFVAGVVKAASAVSDTILDTSDLAKTIGATTAELNALQRAGVQFRIPKETFTSGIKALSDEILNAEQGYGNLFQLARDGAIEIRDSKGQMLPTLEIFMRILEAMRNVKDERFGRRLGENILGDPNFYDISQNIEQFKEFNNEFKQTSQAIQQAENDARRFDRELTKLSETAKEFTVLAFTPLIEFLGRAITDVNDTIKSAREGTFFDKMRSDLMDFYRDFDEGFNNISRRTPLTTGLAEPLNRQINMRNTINITVPPGTDEAQAQFIRTGVEQAVNETFDKNFQSIGDNFPETE